MSRAARTAVASGVVSVVCAIVLAFAHAAAVESLLDTPLFMIMLASTAIALVAGVLGMRGRDDRRLAAGGIVLTIPALIVIAMVALVLIALVTGEFQPS